MQSTARASLRAAVGAPRDVDLPVADDVPAPTLPREALDALEQAARAHPRMEAYELRAQSHEAQAGAAEADRLPSFVLGVDWIETGEASMPVNGSGDDALLVSVGVRLPLFGQDAAAEAQAAEHAEGDAQRAMRQAAENDAIAELSAAWSSVRDSHRRLALYETTLIPQARAAQESVNGAYAASELGAANLITAQRALLEIAGDPLRDGFLDLSRGGPGRLRARRLHAREPEPGAPLHVGVLLDNVPEYWLWLAAAALCGGVVVGINPTRRGAELARDIEHTDCQWIVTEPRHRALLDGLALGAPLLEIDSPPTRRRSSLMQAR